MKLLEKYKPAKKRARKIWETRKAAEALQIVNAHPRGIARIDLAVQVGVSVATLKTCILPRVIDRIDIVGSQNGGWVYEPKKQRATFD